MTRSRDVDPAGRPAHAGVVVRRATPADAELVAAWRDEPSTARYMPNRRRSVEELRARLAERAAPAVDPNLAGTVQWMIEANGEPVGWVRLTVTDRENGLGDVGYTVGERFRGRGYASAGLRAAVAAAFAPTGADLDRLEAVAAVGNAASRRVLEKAGFRAEGVARGLLAIGGERVDHVRYGLLRDEWAAGSGQTAEGG
jgi:ribosomal-protein-alanine N-acetyltransferase